MLAFKATNNVFAHLLLECLVDTPVVIVRNIVDKFPEFRVSELALPGRRLDIEQAGPFWRQKGGYVYAIGDVPEGIFRRRHLGPDITLHARRHTTMDAADTVVKAGSAQAKAGHVESVFLALGTQGKYLLEIQPGFVQVPAQGMLKQASGKDVVAGCNRCMGGEQSSTGDCLQRGLEIQPTGHDPPATLEYLKRGMAFVDVPDGRIKPQSFKYAGSPDTQKHFLADSSGFVAAIKLQRQLLVFGAVFLSVTVQQVQPNMAHPRFPDAGHHITTRKGHGYL